MPKRGSYVLKKRPDHNEFQKILCNFAAHVKGVPAPGLRTYPPNLMQLILP